MIGYMTRKEATASGMTHHGSYFGIPVWMAPCHPDFLVCAKWRPFDYLMIVFHHIEGVVRSIVYPDDPPCFQFTIREEIHPSK